jgi:hypothetical protein
MDDPSFYPDLDPDLWLEAGSSGGPNKNRVYGLSNTTTQNLRMTRSVSIIGYSWSVLSTQTLEFAMMLDHKVQAQTTELRA